MRFNGKSARKPSLAILAAALEQIAEMDALPRVPFHQRAKEEAPMRDLNYDFKQLCRRNRDGSYATQADREHILDLCADQLHEMGIRELRAQGFKPKHVQMLVERWLADELSPGTIKNRMSALR